MKPLASKSTTTVPVIYHDPKDRGPRHTRFPDINVSMTARAHGISKSQLSRLLNGRSRPSLKSIVVLCKVLGKSMDAVLEMFRGVPAAAHVRMTAEQKQEQSRQKEERREINAKGIVPRGPGNTRNAAHPRTRK